MILKEKMCYMFNGNGIHVWMPVQIKKPISDETVECHADDISTSELSKLDSIEYCGRHSDNTPGVILRKGRLEVWTPIAARLWPRIIKLIPLCTFLSGVYINI